MKVAIIGPAYPLRGGIAHHVCCLQRELTARGHSTQVVSFSKLYPSLFFPGTTELDQSASVIDAHAKPLLSPLNPISWFSAFKEVKAFAPDVVIFQWWQPFFAPMIGTLVRAFRRNGIKCVLECHNVYPHERSPFDRLLLGFAARSANSFITHSNQDRIDLLPIVPGKRIDVSPLPTPAEFLGPTTHPRDGRTVLFFGKVRKYKGLEVLLAAMPKVISRIHCQLRIVGEFYDSVERYQKLIQLYGLQEYVTIDNRYVPNEEVVEILNQADVLVLPYLSATQSAVARIALSNALPIIASKTGGLAEVVVENVNGLLFPAGNADALADCIVSYFEDRKGPVFASNLRVLKDHAHTVLGKVIEEMGSELI
jgi:glycosyltransferase involved in cell wall biosynthesis